MDLTGYFLNPLSTAKILIKDSFYKGYPINNSTVHLRLRRHHIEATGNIADKINIQQLIFPYKEGEPVKLQVTAINLNIKEMFLLKSDPLNYTINFNPA